jgi:hypothetical protein
MTIVDYGRNDMKDLEDLDQNQSTEVDNFNVDTRNSLWVPSAGLELSLGQSNVVPSSELPLLENPLSPTTFNREQWLFPADSVSHCASPVRKRSNEALDWSQWLHPVESFSRGPSPIGQSVEHRSEARYPNDWKRYETSKAERQPVCECLTHSHDCLKSVLFAAEADVRCICCKSYVDWNREFDTKLRMNLLSGVILSAKKIREKQLQRDPEMAWVLPILRLALDKTFGIGFKVQITLKTRSRRNTSGGARTC